MRLRDSSAKAERLVDKADVIVDSLRNSNDGDLQLSLPDLVENGLSTAVGAVSTNNIYVREAVLHDAVNNLLSLETTWM